MNSLLSTCSRLVLVCTSTTGDSPVTVIVSCTPPTRISALTVRHAAAAQLESLARATVTNPGRVKVTS